MHKRIIYTRYDGGVSVCCPAKEIIRAMGCGGLWLNPTRGFIETQIARKIARGVIPDAAHRFCTALAFGGQPTSYALEIIRDADCGHLGVAHELVDLDELPADRAYRDAWRRSPNGGPIWIDEDKAQHIDEDRMWQLFQRQR